MFDTVLFFGRKNCKYSNYIKKLLKKKSYKFQFIESNFLGERLNNKILKYSYYDYIFCFRSFYILKKNILKKCKISSINFHPGPPEYRGVGCINYALYDEAKHYGCTAHIMNGKIDSGKIINVKRFRIKKNDNIESCLRKTYKLILNQAKILINSLDKDKANLAKLIHKSRNEKWSKKIKSRSHLNEFYRISKNINRKNLIKKIRATNTKNFKPYILLHSKKFDLI